MKEYFVGKQPASVLENFGARSPRELLTASLDVVEFVVYLEEKLDREIDINALGDTLINSNFQELSEHVARLLEQEG